MGVNPTQTNFNTFTFDGENSRNYGVYITGEGVFNAPERNVEMVEIPGRNGAFALDKGNFNNIEVTYPAGIFADTEADFAQAVSDMRNWLCSKVGYVRLEDDYNPNEYRMAIYKSGLEVDHDFLIAGEFDLVFECKPQRYLKSGETPITIGEWGETTTYTGEIAQFENPNGYLAVKSLTADIEPLQDLHGYDKPWVGGAGKNKLPTGVLSTKGGTGVTATLNDDGSISLSGTPNATQFIGYQFSIKAGSYVLNGCPTGGGSSTYQAQIRQSALDGTALVTDTGSGTVFNPTADLTVYYSIRIASGYTIPTGTIFKPMIRLSTESDATYEPWENICPITGWTGCEVNVSGKNIFATYDSLSWTPSVTKNTDGTLTVVGNRTANGAYEIGAVFLKANITYTMKASGSADLYFQMRDANGNVVAFAGINDANYTPTSDEIVTIRLFARANITFDTVLYPQIETGETSTTYEPYNPNSAVYNITWQDDAGTVYGGTVDVVSGVLTAYPYYASYNGETLVGPWVSSMDEYVQGATPATGAQVVDLGGTPTTYQLTGEQIDLLIGHNNVWNNVGDTSIEVGNDPQYVINPTRFDAQPLLEVVGYGTIDFVGSPIKVFNENVGAVGINSPSVVFDKVVFGGSRVFYTSLNESPLNVGDSIIVSGEKVEITMGYPLSTVSGVTVTSTTNCSATARQGGSNVWAVSIELNQFSFVKGTGSTATASCVVSITLDGVAQTYTFTRTAQYRSWDIKQSMGCAGSTTGSPQGSFRVYIPQIVGVSTKSTQGITKKIDLGLGYAWNDDFGEQISMNDIVQLPSELPTLASGANTITYDNTITQLDIVPRWWQV